MERAEQAEGRTCLLKDKVVFVWGAITTGKSRLFVDLALHFNDKIINSDKIQVYKGLNIATRGGSNSFVKALVDDNLNFVFKFDYCFLWMHLSLTLLDKCVYDRVDQMVEVGLPNEVKGMFDHNVDYTRVIRCSISVLELDEFFRVENNPNLNAEATRLLE
ncbi:adenylate isopentenyltransferase 5, chloroplastic-like [Impatiens glandulifera]|uniref:adenylate isopentenyltransferase 5, chloroplastic-like n=1 Tax=Impatiens glandulifera TaxID=253017 RepID=UPI001FB12538|nr:adenylate isopentenyltransferase 5, chloroplastic-like [Impatiens glandulifera]